MIGAAGFEGDTVDLGHIDDALLRQIALSHLQEYVAWRICALQVGRDRTHYDSVDEARIKQVVLNHNVRVEVPRP